MEYSYQGHLIKIIEYSPGMCTGGWDAYVNGKHITFQNTKTEAQRRAELYVQNIKSEVK